MVSLLVYIGSMVLCLMCRCVLLGGCVLGWLSRVSLVMYRWLLLCWNVCSWLLLWISGMLLSVVVCSIMFLVGL